MPIDVETRRKLDLLTKSVDKLREAVAQIAEEIHPLIKAPKKAVPLYIAKKILPDGTLSGGIEANASSINVLENIIDDDDDYNEKQRFALYKLVKEYES
jgi:hypothetical protein